eukprot:m.81889 g.81889  ORF g.81889 m.81889 type:complete len:572 (+) comp16320_c1_seq8:283-1998(+)
MMDISNTSQLDTRRGSLDGNTPITVPSGTKLPTTMAEEDNSFFDLLNTTQSDRMNAQRSGSIPMDRPMLVPASVVTPQARSTHSRMAKKHAAGYLLDLTSPSKIGSIALHFSTTPAGGATALHRRPPASGYGSGSCGPVAPALVAVATAAPGTDAAYHVRDMLCAGSTQRTAFPALPVEVADPGADYYRLHFFGQDHINFVGVDDTVGASAVSVRRRSHRGVASYHVIARTIRGGSVRFEIEEDNVTRKGDIVHPSDVLAATLTPSPLTSLKALRQARVDAQLPEKLRKLDECNSNGAQEYKFGIIHCRKGQTTEDEMYANTTETPELCEFLDHIGERVALKGMQGFRAGLDNASDLHGTHTYHSRLGDATIVFHVAPMMPSTEKDTQSVAKKRHLGNNSVTVVYVDEDAGPIDPSVFCSNFQKVFIVVQRQASADDAAPVTRAESGDAPCRYAITVVRKGEVPDFGPDLYDFYATDQALNSGLFQQVLLTTAINAENAYAPLLPWKITSYLLPAPFCFRVARMNVARSNRWLALSVMLLVHRNPVDLFVSSGDGSSLILSALVLREPCAQ